MMRNILVSACLLGQLCRYDQKSKSYPQLDQLWLRPDITLIPICPEQAGGLATPRVPAECSKGKVYTRDGRDVTAAYERGAAETLRLARLYHCQFALLKAKSPSCGKKRIYDGTFTHTLTEGNGITAAVLQKAGITVFSELEIKELISC